MSKASLKRLNTPSKFTRNMLREVTDERFEDAIYVLTHSYAARNTFAWLQYELSVDDLSTMRAYEHALEAISCEVAHKAHGRRRTAVPCYAWYKLAEELRVPDEVDEWGETHIRTIVGWWQV